MPGRIVAGAGIVHEGDEVAEIGGIAHFALDALVGDNAGDDQHANAQIAQGLAQN